MFYRALAAAIVLFWLVMTGLLVRLECFPEASDLLPMPVDRLCKLMFLHAQASDLILFSDQDRIGSFQLQPHRFPPRGGAGRNLLAMTGSLQLHLAGLDVHHLTLRGALELDDQNEARHFEVTATLPDPRRDRGLPAPKSPPSLVIVLDGEPLRGHYHYAVRSGDTVLAEQAGTAEELLDQPELRDYGLSPAVLDGLLRQQAAATRVTARRGFLHAKGEDIETYEIKFRQGETVVATVEMSQLGQILAIKTAAGYSLLDDTLAP